MTSQDFFRVTIVIITLRNEFSWTLSALEIRAKHSGISRELKHLHNQFWKVAQNLIMASLAISRPSSSNITLNMIDATKLKEVNGNLIFFEAYILSYFFTLQCCKLYVLSDISNFSNVFCSFQ